MRKWMSERASEGWRLRSSNKKIDWKWKYIRIFCGHMENKHNNSGFYFVSTHTMACLLLSLSINCSICLSFSISMPLPLFTITLLPSGPPWSRKMLMLLLNIHWRERRKKWSSCAFFSLLASKTMMMTTTAAASEKEKSNFSILFLHSECGKLPFLTAISQFCMCVWPGTHAFVRMLFVFVLLLLLNRNIFCYDYCYDFIICLLFKFNVEPLMISSENKLHTHTRTQTYVSWTVIMNKTTKRNREINVRRPNVCFFFSRARRKNILFIQ